MNKPIPRWRGDRDYFTRSSPEYNKHVKEIDIQQTINRKIDMAAGDDSWSVTIRKGEMKE